MSRANVACMQDLVRKYVRAEEASRSYDREQYHEQSRGRAAELREQELERERDAGRDFERQLLAAQKLAKGLQEQLRTERVRARNSGGAA